MGRPWLEIKYTVEIDGEPYYATFKSGTKSFTLANFHAITKDKHPETEVKYFKDLPTEYPDLNLIFCGDFNLPQDHSVFNSLKNLNYASVLKNQKTSLKMECAGSDCLASEFDNFFFNAGKCKTLSSGIIHFYQSFPTLMEARKISDHVPIYCQFMMN